ncbi:hypothetical protein GDO81_011856 [Engystomops pustulosus]|uniref:Uncharacterized protein n=1 Tax=Engystomops pustulosus TaxID=76066 RepID=A0AAV7BHI9_ENGPU|nr:hypothetical protein GDO81_011856 [Engystomops pustulosus]
MHQRECRICGHKLPTNYDKATCNSCTGKILTEESSIWMESLRNVVREGVQRAKEVSILNQGRNGSHQTKKIIHPQICQKEIPF